ncbi:M-phase phosphoprotein 8 [Plakobranchus ocellatus]|uniref:M-phase phosphoprotein 8 n=1 Tax=Plakobranchus ocellatus TaxID=259542 RepID=A0AAV4B5F0_9GAST|nr:M-phase phosphoprotein 8 [Plakobranchus ocellatus]
MIQDLVMKLSSDASFLDGWLKALSGILFAASFTLVFILVYIGHHGLAAPNPSRLHTAAEFLSTVTWRLLVILPILGQDRLASNDNTAEAEKDIDVLEGPEVEISSCEFLSDNGNDSEFEDMEPGQKEGDVPKSIHVGVKSQNDGPALAPATAEPDNRFYEVEAIIDGPKRRREHLSKICYKVRWKGYGPEADTWQPTRDLSNVQDMVEEYRKEKAEKAKNKRKMIQKPVTGTTDEKLLQGPATSQRRASAEDTSDDDEKDYDPEYGTVKDKFWKDLELGRHQNHAQLFSGDMYSKVKGCRRAAHAEAVANIQKQQQPNSKTEAASSSIKTSPPQQKAAVKLKLQRMSGKKNSFKASPSISSSLVSTKKTLQPPKPLPGSAARARKRSSDPFSASGYTSVKRSRRSKEVKAIKRSSLSSVSSETIGIVTTTCPLSPSAPAALTDSASATSVISTSSVSGAPSSSASSLETQLSANTSGVWDGRARETLFSETNRDDDVFKTPAKEEVVRVKDSKIQSAVADPGQQLGMEEDVIRPEEIVKLCSDENFLSDSAESSAAGIPNTTLSLNKEGTTTVSHNLLGGHNDFPTDKKEQPETLKPLTKDIPETGGAIERSHDQECLWGGACNRSDCRSNRRRNMKNGQGEGGSGETRAGSAQQRPCRGRVPEESLSSTTPSESVSSTSTASVSSTSIEKSSSTASPSTPGASSSSKHHSSPSASKQNPSGSGFTPPKTSQTSPSSGHHGSAGTAGGESRASLSRSLFSSPRAHSSDSSFDDSPQPGSAPDVQLSKQVVSDTFRQSSCLASGNPETDSSLNITSPSKTISSAASLSVVRQFSGHRNPPGARRTSGVGSDVSERPGLFSEGNSAFSFARQDSGFAGDSPGSATILPSPTGSLNVSSPGKENFRSMGGVNVSVAPAVSSTSSRDRSVPHQQQQQHQHLPMEVGVSDTQPDSTVVTGTVSPHPTSTHPRSYPEPQEVWAAGRKRAFDLPLEKIPSPNSKKESDIDKRISTLTCDDLEDFIDQGEERCFGQKETGFITNADLLQAVNLSKAEVVKRAIRLSSCSERRMDFEQPDNAGVTLLMKAVQKGSLAIAEMLLEHGVNVNSQQANGTTALMIAAEQNNTGLVALLLKYGANSSLYTVISDQAETAIMKAIRRQQKEVVSLMLRVGVNLAAPTCGSLSVLELAIERRNPQIEALVRAHHQRLDQAFRSRVLATLGDTVELMEPLFALQCFPLREAQMFEVKFNSFIHPVAAGEGFILFIAHTKINEKGVRCRFHGGCPISSVILNGITQSPLTKEVNFVTSCHPIVSGCNTLKIHKQADYTSKAKLLVQAFRAKLLPC